jgi:hypothetical protein
MTMVFYADMMTRINQNFKSCENVPLQNSVKADFFVLPAFKNAGSQLTK